MTTPPQPSTSDLEAFRALLTRETGLGFDDDKLPLLEETLATRVLATGSQTVGAYLERAAPTSQEIAELAPRLTTSETYFFRDPNQFRAVQAILREHEASTGRHLRLLSAGCSSGEEAYTLAIVIRETLRNLDEWTISIQGVDLNPEVLGKARSACYPAWSLRGTPEGIRRRYFEDSGARHVLADGIRTMARFELRNLVGGAPGLWGQEGFDIVFCRNVLMYLTPWAAAGVVASIARSLAPGGYLFLGHAENLRGLSRDFDLQHAHDTFYYRRRATRPAGRVAQSGEPCHRPVPAMPPAVTDTSWFQIIDRASRRVAQLSSDTQRGGDRPAEHDNGGARRAVAPHSPAGDLSPAMDLMRQERFQEALGLLADATGAAAPGPDALLLRAMLLVSAGQAAQAEQVCEDIIGLDQLNAGAHYIQGLCREYAGDRTGAVEHNQIAAYLDSEFAMPHLQLGRLARQSGDVVTARRELETAVGLLPREDPARVLLFGGGFGREFLMQLCRGELEACGGGG